MPRQPDPDMEGSYILLMPNSSGVTSAIGITQGEAATTNIKMGNRIGFGSFNILNSAGAPLFTVINDNNGDIIFNGDIIVSGKILAANGSGPDPSYSFVNAQTTGLFLNPPSEVSLSIGAVDVARFTPQGLIMVPVGNSVEPVFCLADDNTTGFYSHAAGIFGFTSQNIFMFSFGRGQMLFDPNGTVLAPIIALSNAQTGLFTDGGSSVAITAFGQRSFSVFQNQALLSNGTNLLPSLGFFDNQSTGFYKPAAGQLAVTLNGGEQLRFVDTFAFQTVSDSESTGAGVTGIGGANNPATTPGSINTWIRVKKSNGDTLFVPAWK